MSWDNVTFFDQEGVSTQKITEDSTSGVEHLSDRVMRKNAAKTMQVVKSLDEIGLPESENDQIRIIAFRAFNVVGFIDWIISHFGTIKEAYIVAFAANEYSGRCINELVEAGKIGKATILISNLRNSAHRQKDIVVRDLWIKNPAITLIYAGSHAKVLALKTEQGCYCVEGSGNLAANSRIEQYVIDRDEKLYNFHRDWIELVAKESKFRKDVTVHA